MGRFGRTVALVLALGSGTVPRLAEAQGAAATTGTSSSAAMSAMYANPYANPYLNPFINPYMTQQPLQGNAALYFYMAQQQNGGLGSGRLSGVRPAANPAPPPAPVTERRNTDRPGASAAGYFNRSYQPQVGASRYFNRSTRYNRSNGR